MHRENIVNELFFSEPYNKLHVPVYDFAWKYVQMSGKKGGGVFSLQSLFGTLTNYSDIQGFVKMFQVIRV